MSDELKEHNFNDKVDNNKEFNTPDGIIIPKKLKPILSDPEISNEKKKTIIKAIISITFRSDSSFSGPIPPPEILKGYNEVVKNGGERIVAMAEKQSNHRMQLDDYVIREELKQSRMGQIFGFNWNGTCSNTCNSLT
ncbi:MAG: DUF2335 domain-containing protein [Sphingobacteriales bacterium]|uniref:DUF2335 domain-containing protein n=1 Tax=Hydrotalea flava TaxID=714549 RepID=UPI0008341935|nr:DUF2335 domain-containing protein [Hydrotalea flava]RTL48857.1 MAG: DUF2335 domain-containing protein [Sphingobacteriales bacterium]